MAYSKTQGLMINNIAAYQEVFASSKQIIFIDSQVEDYQLLAKGTLPGIEIVILNDHSDGIKQITSILNQRNNLTAVHIVSHGSPGCLYLGNTHLSLDTLTQYQLDLKTWFSQSPSDVERSGANPLGLPVSQSPQLLIYGCNVAAGDAGAEFITKLNKLTGAEIAASTTPIGNANLGGNWELDVTSNHQKTFSPFSEITKQNYSGVLADETVDNSGAETIAVGGSTTKTFTITEDLNISDVTLGLNAEHTWRGDVEVILTSPQGTSVTLITTDVDDPSDNFDLLLQDGSANSFRTGANEDTAAPIYGGDLIAAPSNPFSAFAGESSIGNWTLTLNNTNVSGRDRTLDYNSSQLNIEGTPNIALTDYGDAPDNASGSSPAPDDATLADYQTTEADGGASHTQDPDNIITIGDTVDADDGTQQNNTATADGADEDGVTVSGSNDSLDDADISAVSGSTYSVDVEVNLNLNPTIIPGATNTVSGQVFIDYDNDGVNDGSTTTTSETGIAATDITVTAYANDGTVLDTATTDASGNYSLDINQPARIEFTDIPDGYNVSSQGNAASDTVGDVFFVDGSTNVTANLGIIDDYVDSSETPRLITSCYVFGSFSGSNAAGVVSVLHTDQGRTPDNKLEEVTFGDIGSTYGLAYNQESGGLFVGAFQKRHSDVGPSGNGAIYQISNVDNTVANDNGVSTFIDLDQFFSGEANTAGAYSHGDNQTLQDSIDGNIDWQADTDAFAAVGKAALGDVEISDDNEHIWTINLADRQLYKVEVGDGSDYVYDGSETRAVDRYDILSGIDNAQLGLNPTQNIRPFALSEKDGLIYVGMVNSAQYDAGGDEGNTTSADLHAYIYTFDPVTETFSSNPVLDFSLDYARDSKMTRTSNGTVVDSEWDPWVDNFDDLTPVIDGSRVRIAESQPILSDIEFDNNGDIIVGLRDRSADQAGPVTPDTNGDPFSNSNLYQVDSGGDILRAAINTDGSGWTIEASVTDADNDLATNPEFYGEEEFATSAATHEETAQGGLVQIPGYNSVETIALDPNRFNSGGIIGLDNTTGDQTRDIELFRGAQPDFAKANGLGDLEAIITPIDTIEIGNRVWVDLNGDGIQDAAEAGIAGTTVNLYDATGTTLLGTTVTDDQGEYYFNESNVNQNGATGLEPNTNYKIRLDNATDFGSGGALENLSITTADANANADDQLDSDAVLEDVSGTDAPTINVTTGDYGENDYTNDFGLTKDVTLKDVTLVGWIDFDRSGTFDADEAVTLDTAGGLNTDGTANTLDFTVPADVEPGETAARFRVASGLDGDNLDATTANGAAPDGEVEDYIVNLVESTETDYGDAPDNASGSSAAPDDATLADYQTTEADGGASHTQDPDNIITIGDTVDADDGTQQNNTATADGADEDGVTVSGSNDSLDDADISAVSGSTYSVDVEVNLNLNPTIIPGATNTVSGQVFIDYDNDGVNDGSTTTTSETGIAATDITVTAYANDGTVLDTATTDASGNYSLDINQPARIEFTDIPDGYNVSSQGNAASDTVGDVFFVDGSTNVTANLGIIDDYVDSSETPRLITSCYVFGSFSGSNAAGVVSVLHTDQGRTPDNKLEEVTFGDIGSTYGLAYNQESGGLFVGAFQKRHSDVGPSGNGAIYQISNVDNTVANDNGVSTFIDLDQFFSGEANTAGAYSHGDNQTLQDSIDGNIDWQADTDAFAAVGKAALGDVEISDDNEHIWTINLADRQLYKVEVGDGSDYVYDGSETRAVDRYDILSGIDNAQLGLNPTQNIRPFALSEKDGLIYVGMVNSAQYDAGGDEGNTTSADLHAYIYTFDPVTETFSSNPVLDFSLDYARDSKMTRTSNGTVVDSEWDPWVDNFDDLTPVIDGSRVRIAESQPILSDIEFDNNGDIIVGLRDRSADQAGPVTPDTNGDPFSNSNLYQVDSGGDILRAAINTDGSGWTIEASVTDADNDLATNPEFYGEEEFATSAATHEETAQGGLVQIPGYNSVETIALDPNRFNSGGIIGLDNTTGDQTRDIELFRGAQPDFAKANGLGDLEAIITPIDTIEIGNRVWVDLNGDGIQDAAEAGIAGTTVNLYDATGTTLLGTTVTDDQGEYYFNESNVNQNGATGLEPNTNYKIRLDNATDFGSGGALENLSITTADANANADDQLDSDAVLEDVSGTDAPTINVTTGDYGENDYTNDFGLTKDVTLKDVTLVGWIDFDRSGTFDADEAVTLDTAGGLNTDGTANTLDFTVPADVEPGETAARFRVASGLDGDNLDATTANGAAPDGEVEDYIVNLVEPAPPTIDLDGDDSILTGTDFETAFLVGGAPVAIADDVLIGDSDDVNLQGASIYLKTRPDGDAAESLGINGTLPDGITTSGFDPVTGTITLTGDAPISDYEIAIAQIEYTNTIGWHSGDRLIEVTVNDGLSNSNTALTTLDLDYAPAIDLDSNDDSFV